MKQWEYKIVFSEVKGWITKKPDPTLEASMNELGGEGWELVSCSPMSGNTSTAWTATTSNFVLVFKRQKAS